jgi:hypothetical protein
MLKYIFIIFFIVVDNTSLRAQQSSSSSHSANDIMPSCRSFLANDRSDIFGIGFCIGSVSATFDLLVHSNVVCNPIGSNYGQAIRIAVQYIDARPQRHHERFSSLVFEALVSAWPCRR